MAWTLPIAAFTIRTATICKSSLYSSQLTIYPLACSIKMVMGMLV